MLPLHALSVIFSCAVPGSGGGDPGYTLSNPATVEIGHDLSFTVQVPVQGLMLFIASLGDGPTNLPWGTMCLDFPPVFLLPLIIPGGVPVDLGTHLPCDDNIIGLKTYQQFVSFDVTDKNNQGISNQTSVEFIAPGGVSGSYSDFSSLSNLQLNGTATQAGNVLQLTADVGSQAGTVFYTTSIALDTNTSFRTRFQFRIHGASRDGADGMTFMIQGNDPFQVGVNGSGLGYGGILDSVAIEIDNWDSGLLDPSDNHIGLLQDGDYTRHWAFANASFDLEDGNSHELWIDYCGASDLLEVYLAEVSGGARPAAPLISRSVDLFGLVGPSGYLGFSGATGGVTNIHDLENWEFRVW